MSLKSFNTIISLSDQHLNYYSLPGGGVGFAVQVGARLGGSTVTEGAGPSRLCALTSTGITPPVETGNTRWRKTSRMEVIEPECAVNEITVL